MQRVIVPIVVGVALGSGLARAAPAPAAVFTNQTPLSLAMIDASVQAAVPISARDVWAVTGNGAGLFAHFDGRDWKMVGKPDPDLSLGDVSAIASGDVWAAGASTLSGEQTQTVAEHWNGAAWSVVSTPTISGAIATSFASIVALADDDVWAAGYYLDGTDILPLFEHWDGAGWTIRSGNSNSGPVINKLAVVSATDIWAVGSVLTSGGDMPFAEHWNGTAWTPVQVPAIHGKDAGGDLYGVTAVSANDVWAVGWSTLPTIGGEITGRPRQTLIEHWDGRRWSIVPSPNVDTASVTQADQLFSIAALSATDVWAVGQFTFPDGSGTIFGGLALHWNGADWAIAPVADSGAHTFYRGVATLAPASVWAVGAGASPGNVSGTGLLLTATPGG